jgi:hypothetical protein
MFLGGRPQDHERSAPSCFLTWSSSTPLRIEPPAGEFAGRCRRQRTLGGTHGPEAHANVTRYLYSYNRLHVMSIENGYQAQYSCVLLHEQRLAMPITLPPRRPSCGGCSERSSCLLCPDASLVMSRTLGLGNAQTTGYLRHGIADPSAARIDELSSDDKLEYIQALWDGSFLEAS